FPTDFSESAEDASLYAISMAEKYQSKIYVVHVIEPFTYTTDLGIDMGDQYQVMEATAKRFLDDKVTSIREKIINVEGILLSGEPFVEIIKYAKLEQVNLIIMATHGRSGFEHMLLGSVAEKVVRKSPCPVLTVKKAGQTFSLP
ncbi:MAG: universal stress protein, partial [Nitrospira sp.]|nr:universal stress protein [Nitrospira sp.]